MWRLIQRLLHWLWKPKGVSSQAERCWVMESSLVLFQTWKEFWPETWKTTRGWNVYGATSTKRTLRSENWPLACPARVAAPAGPPPLPLQTPPCPTDMTGMMRIVSFCLKPGHMRTIKNSSFQNLQPVNEHLNLVSSLRMQPRPPRLPPAMAEELFIHL